jgi:hypothetical protein
MKLDNKPKTWLDVAQDVNSGKYIRADNSTRQAIEMGLKWSSDHAEVKKALEMIERGKRRG